MVKSIKKLTDDQKSAMPAWRDKWIKIGLSTEPADRPRAEAAYRECYRAANLRDDVPIVWVESPLVGALAAPTAANLLAYWRHSAVDSAVDSAVGSAVYKKNNLFWHNWMGGSLWSAWPAFESFFREVCGLKINDNLANSASAFAETSVSAGYWWPNKNFIIACERPAEINMDEDGNLHCETHAAIMWRDGWGVCVWHGTRVPDHWILSRANLDPREVISHDNVEVRAAGCAIVGWGKMFDVLDAKVVHDSGSPDIGQLIELTLPGLSDPGRFLKAECPRNGTICEGVPFVDDFGLPINTALHAQAWRVGLHPSEYLHPEVRT